MKAETDRLPGEAHAIVATMNSAADGRRILQLRLNRPDKRNALTLAMLEELHRCLSEQTDAIVLTSAGPSFCAGLDLDECRADPAWPRPLRHLELLATVYQHLLNNPSALVAFVQGFAVGGGVGLAVCADLVVATSDARLRLPEESELASLARIVQPVVEARQIARRGAVVWRAGELDAYMARKAGLIDEIREPTDFATLRDQASRGILPDLTRHPSWRPPDRGQAIERGLNAILTGLSR